MTEAEARAAAPPAGEPDRPDVDSPGVYSKDYWDIVFDHVGKRRMVQIALALLALMYASAIYAPFLASDRPFVLEAIDYKEYSRSQKTVYPVTLSVERLAKQSEEEFTASQTDPTSKRTLADALEEERQALRNRLDTMRSYLPDADRGPLDALEKRVDAAVAAARSGDRDEAQRLAGLAKDEAKALKSEYVAADPDQEGSAGKVLTGVRSHPLLETTTWIEAFFMVLWAFVLCWPLWNRILNRALLGGDRDRIRAWRRRKLLGVLGISAVAALLWGEFVGGSATFESAPFKAGLTSGELVAKSVVFPPIALGMAESNLSERFRPPTWKANAEISEEGYYVRGPRAPEPDPITGSLPPTKPVEVRFDEPARNSGWRHPLGTDSLGRDLLVRILYGGRISLAVGLVSTVLLVVIGVVIGSVAGYFGGWVDILVSRVIEIFQGFPAFFLILTAVALIPEEKLHPIFAIIFFIAIVRWTGVARLVRGEFLRLKEQEFAIAARALGLSSRRIIFKHVLPNAMGPVLVSAAFSIASGIITESTISFLGLGIKHPIPSWGSLINESRDLEQWWIQVFPGVLIFLTVFCYNYVGEGVRDALDPRRRA